MTDIIDGDGSRQALIEAGYEVGAKKRSSIVNEVIEAITGAISKEEAEYFKDMRSGDSYQLGFYQGMKHIRENIVSQVADSCKEE